MSSKLLKNNVTSKLIPDWTQIGGGKIEFLDVMKFYGILLVVFGHITNSWTSITTYYPPTESALMQTLTDIIYSFHMPMFVWVSGCIYGYQKEILHRKQPLAILTKNKFKRLIIPYFAFGTLWVVPVMYLLGLRPQPFRYLFEGVLLAGDNRHLWYVLMLFWAFIIYELLEKLCKKLNISSLWILLVAVLLYANPVYFPYFGLGTIGYIFWFVLGYQFVSNTKVAPYVVGASLILGTILTCINTPHTALLQRICYGVIGISLFYIISNYRSSLTKISFYQLISKNSFGIYLIHPMIIYSLRPILFQYEINPVVATMIIFTITIIISVLISIVLRNFRMGVVIGE